MSLKKPMNPEELGLVNLNQTGMDFYLIVKISNKSLNSLDILK